MLNPIKVFEYQILEIDTFGFTQEHWKLLGTYNVKHGSKYFTLLPFGVRFNQYVGVIQVGNLTIEILPKIERHSQEGNIGCWRKVLIDMLQECRWMKLVTNDNASLKFRSNSILEAYLSIFVSECEQLCRLGLIKKYRAEEGNVLALKGKLLTGKNIQKNLIHQERFFTRHQVYDKNNIYNQILFKALEVVSEINKSSLLKDRIEGLFLSFPEMSKIKVTSQTFERLTFDRKTESYRQAISIAAMLLLNYRPDISSGKNKVLAILFDMNDLWEEYIYRQLLKHKPDHWIISAQNPRAFWQSESVNYPKIVKPDIVILDETTCKQMIIDTKWKIPDDNIPGDNDLKQMFVYNEYWSGKTAILLYPSSKDSLEYFSGSFQPKPSNPESHDCGVMKISVLNPLTGGLDKEIGKKLKDFMSPYIEAKQTTEN